MVETVRGTTTRGRSEEPAGGSAPNGDTALKALARLLARQAAAELLGAGDVGSGGTSGGPEPSPSLAIPHELRDID